METNLKNKWQIRLAVLLIFFLWQVIGSIPTGILIAWELLYGNVRSLTEAVKMAHVNPLLTFTALMLASVCFIIGIFLAIRFIHGRKMRTLITPARTLSWRRFWLGFGLWTGLSVLSAVVEAVTHPGRYELTFDPIRLIPYAILALIFVVPLWQVITELRRGEKPQALDVLRQKPTAANLRAYERDLEDASEAAKLARPWAQYAQFAWFKDGGEKAIVGNDGWLFYGPGLEYLTRKPNPTKHTTVSDALSAIIDFRDQLSTRGIKLVVLPAPNKESIYPEKVSRCRLVQPGLLSQETRDLLAGLERAQVPVVNLFELFAGVRRTNDANLLYLVQDSHWSPKGVALAAQAAARPGPRPRAGFERTLRGRAHPSCQLERSRRGSLIPAHGA